MKRVKDAAALRALAAARGARVEDAGGVFNAEHARFRVRAPAAAPVAEAPSAGAEPAKPAVAEAPANAELLRLARGVELAAQIQADTTRRLIEHLAARPTHWRFAIERDANGQMQAVTVEGAHG